MGDLHEVIAACADFGLAALFERMMNLPNCLETLHDIPTSHHSHHYTITAHTPQYASLKKTDQPPALHRHHPEIIPNIRPGDQQPHAETRPASVRESPSPQITS